MIQAEFNKITIGSIVRYTIIPQFVGIVLDKANTYLGQLGNFLKVDFPPNDSTHGGDPDPMWLRAESLGVVEYAGQGTSKIPVEVLDAIDASILEITDDLIIISQKIDELRKL